MSFESPNYTQTPNDLFDKHLPDMGLAEIKVALAIIRHTFGYHKDSAALSIRELVKLTGLTDKSVMEGAEQAEGRGIIERTQDGNKTSVWTARVVLTPTPRSSSSDAGVVPTPTLLGVKETKERGKKGDLFDGVLHYMQEGKARGIDEVEATICRLEVAFRATFPRSARSQTIARWIMAREKEGQALDTFVQWAKRDEFNLSRTYEYAEMPEKIRTRWPQAFTAKTTQPKNPGGSFYG